MTTKPNDAKKAVATTLAIVGIVIVIVVPIIANITNSMVIDAKIGGWWSGFLANSDTIKNTTNKKEQQCVIKVWRKYFSDEEIVDVIDGGEAPGQILGQAKGDKLTSELTECIKSVK